MVVKTLTAVNFRNIRDVRFSPAENVNIIYGDNAQGKTNLLEALWMFTGAKSFRGAGIKEGELIAFESEAAALSLDFFAQDREQDARLRLSRSGKKEVFLNGAQKESASVLAGRFCAVAFSPAHLSIVSEGPGERRRFLDLAIGQIRPVYASLQNEYQRALTQRNALLKDIPYHSELLDTVELWDERLARAGASIMRLRMKYIDKLSVEAGHVYAGISREKECLCAAYHPSVPLPGDPTVQTLHTAILHALKEDLKEDIKAGFTARGAHRDEMDVCIDSLSVKSYGSQGQKRSAVLSLKLAESAILREVNGENPVILLDDVMSELDLGRQEYILNHVRDKQVFITCCDTAVCGALKAGAVFHIQEGGLVQ